MKQKLSTSIKPNKKNIFFKIQNIIDFFVTWIFYLVVVCAIILTLGSIFYSFLYPFASKNLLLSSEIIILMLLLYWTSKYKYKTIYRIIWILTLYRIISLIFILPNVQKVMDFEDCNDVEYCKSFVRENINQEDCLKNNGAWNIDEQACDYRYNLDENCKKRNGNWVYPAVCNE